MFVYSSSKGSIRLCDMREQALCDKHAKSKFVCCMLDSLNPSSGYTVQRRVLKVFDQVSPLSHSPVLLFSSTCLHSDVLSCLHDVVSFSHTLKHCQ